MATYRRSGRDDSDQAEESLIAAVSAYEGKTAPGIEDELGAQVGVAGSTILVLQECLKEFREFGLHYDLAACLTELAGLANTVGEPARAVRLFGAAAALRESVGCVLALVYRAPYERDVAATRIQLDAATWDAAWTVGQTMTLDQAIAEALAISS